MDIQARLTGFAMLGATWVMWVLVGLSIGGVAIALDRAIYLIRTSDNFRRLKRELRPHPRQHDRPRERFVDIVDGADLESVFLVDRIGLCG